MPDGSSNWVFPNVIPSFPPYTYFGPKPLRNDLLIDHQGVFLADPDSNIIGYIPTPIQPVGRLAVAQRSAVRDE
jgi:hypothetical protein